MNDYTYEEYLKAWEDLFGDEETGDCGYYVRGKFVVKQVQRLTEEQFESHLAALTQADEKFDAAHKEGSDEGMEAAIMEAFPHEIVLLL